MARRMRLKDRIAAAMADVSIAAGHGDQTLAKADVILDELAEVLDDYQEHGVDVTLDIPFLGKPITVNIKPGKGEK